jgi:sugar (pentulose or hexulose) kinase
MRHYSSLAFDLGGSGAKLLLGEYDGGGIRLSELARFPNHPTPIAGGLYWDIVGICGRFLLSLRNAAAAHPIRSIGIDSFSNDFCLVDAAGSLLSPARCYRDGRGARHAASAYARVPPRRLYGLTGNQNAPFNTLMQLAAMQAEGQGWLLERADRLLFVPDLLLYILTGEATAEYTIASVSQLYSFADGAWSRELLDAFGLKASLFCGISHPGATVGRISRSRLALGDAGGASGMKNYAAAPGSGNKGDILAVSVCEHDTASAFLAAPAAADYGQAAIISSGTWSIVGCELPRPLICEAGFLGNLANEGGYPGHHRFSRNAMGAWIMQEIRSDCELRGKPLTFAQIEDAASRARAFEFLIDADDRAFYAPGDMQEKVRSWCSRRYGRAPDGIGAIARCVYESTALGYRRAMDLLESAIGRPLPVINIVGGGARDRLLCQFTASACNRPVMAGPCEATALGNLAVQLIAAGELSSVGQAREMIRGSFEPEWYEPSQPEAWDERYQALAALLEGGSA